MSGKAGRLLIVSVRSSMKNYAVDHYVGKCFLASEMTTDMRLFASMNPPMHFQGTALDKPFATPFRSAMVRAFVGMYTEMTAEIRLPVESLKV
ncbi:hypothetical protein N7478_010554 [Penicillium angulare]|uniref:uncharacterized protein n=1 Tax=Penicillium angulare TaxID=116970 RepID=UPI00253F7BFB|nr:uncharacterized protein N7478_010554 [Penicillium angulare]KAJ5267746.1 hypothetical protein N7478_010554 [Penicillium angulare]